MSDLRVSYNKQNREKPTDYTQLTSEQLAEGRSMRAFNYDSLQPAQQREVAAHIAELFEEIWRRGPNA